MPDLEDTTKNILQVVLYLFIPQRVHAQIQKIVPREGGGVQCMIKFSWRRGGGGLKHIPVILLHSKYFISSGNFCTHFLIDFIVHI